MEKGTVYSQWDVDDLLKNLSSELHKYTIDKELQHTDCFIFCVAPFDFVRGWQTKLIRHSKLLTCNVAYHW